MIVMADMAATTNEQPYWSQREGVAPVKAEWEHRYFVAEKQSDDDYADMFCGIAFLRRGEM